jgi:hypothetical protein
MTLRRLLIAGLTSAGTCLTPAGAAATTLAPAPSYTIVAGGGQYIFVMLGHLRSPGDNTRAETEAMRAAYPQSGMYRNDGTKTLLWAFGEPDRYVYREELDVLPDGVHLVVHKRGAKSPDQVILIFYARGEKLHSYPARELVSWWSHFPNKGSGRQPYFEYLESVGFDTETLECTARTHDGNRFVFDVRTGRIVSAAKWSPWVGVVLVVALPTATWLAVRLFTEVCKRVVPRWVMLVACGVSTVAGIAWLAGGNPGTETVFVVTAVCAVLVGVRVRRKFSIRLTVHGSQSGSA